MGWRCQRVHLDKKRPNRLLGSECANISSLYIVPLLPGTSALNLTFSAGKVFKSSETWLAAFREFHNRSAEVCPVEGNNSRVVMNLNRSTSHSTSPTSDSPFWARIA